MTQIPEPVGVPQEAVILDKLLQSLSKLQECLQPPRPSSSFLVSYEERVDPTLNKHRRVYEVSTELGNFKIVHIISERDARERLPSG